MSKEELIPETETEAPLELVGGKGRGLLKLKTIEDKLKKEYTHSIDIVVPKFFIVPPEINLVKNYSEIVEWAEKLNSELYSVRSSSPLEDVTEQSFDGIFDTQLNVSKERLIRTIHKIRKSATSDKAKAYAKDVGVELDEKMPVIVQAMEKGDYNVIVYSKFPCPKEIVKVIRIDPFEKGTNYIDAYPKEISENGKKEILFGEPIVISRRGRDKEVEPMADLAVSIENKFSYPVIIECIYTSRYNSKIDKDKISLLQARKLTKISEAEKFQMPELQEEGLIATSYDLNGVGDFTGEAFVVPEAYGGGASYFDIEDLIKFDKEHKEGYIFVSPYLEFSTVTYDDVTTNKKAVIAHGDLGRHHDFEIARKKGLLYINAKDCLHMGFWKEAHRDSKKLPIETGNKVRVVSDGEKALIFNLSRG